MSHALVLGDTLAGRTRLRAFNRRNVAEDLALVRAGIMSWRSFYNGYLKIGNPGVFELTKRDANGNVVEIQRFSNIRPDAGATQQAVLMGQTTLVTGDTVQASPAPTVNGFTVNAGHGVKYRKGAPIVAGSQGSIISSIATDAITVSPAFASAPASGNTVTSAAMAAAYMALSGTTAGPGSLLSPGTGDTSLANEVTAGALARTSTPATFTAWTSTGTANGSHTGPYKLQATWTSDQASAYYIGGVGVFDDTPNGRGTLWFEAPLSSVTQLNQNESLTLTYTITI